MKKRVITMLLVFCIQLSFFPTEVFAAKMDTLMETPVGSPEYTANTSLGTLLTRTLENDEGDTRFPCTVTDLRVEGKNATVELSTDRECDLLVAIYPDSDKNVRMLASGTVQIGAGKKEVSVSIEIEVMPEFFIAVAYLLDPETHEPLSDSYISRYYTAEFQAFLQTTTADYEQELVLNLDGDEGNNFLVFGEDVLRISETPGVNELSDNGNGTYTVRKADARFRSLKAGDSFAYTYTDGTLLIVVVASVSVDGDTVTVVEDTEATLEAVFSYIKIDTTSIPGEGEVDLNGADNGVFYSGLDVAELTTYEATNTPYFDNTNDKLEGNEFNTKLFHDEASGELIVGSSLARNVDESFGTSFSFILDLLEDTPAILKGSVLFKASAAVKIYRSDLWFSATVKLDYSAGINVDIGGKYEGKILLGKPTLPLGVSGMMITFPLYFVIEAEGKLTVGGELKGTVGTSYDSDTGFTDLTSWPSFEAKAELSVTVFLGFEMEIDLKTVIPKVLTTGISVKAGAELKTKLTGSKYDPPSDSKRHDCSSCIEGDVKIRATVKFKFEALFGIVKRAWTPLDIKAKIADFYYSLDPKYGDYGWFMTCPHISYMVSIDVIDKKGNAISDAMVSQGGNDIGLTSKDGRIEMFYPNGVYQFVIKKDSRIAVKTITVMDSKKSIQINLDDNSDGSHGTVVDSGICGANLTWVLYVDGTLVISGTGKMYDSLWYQYQPAPWNLYVDDILSVVTNNGVTSIGGFAFENCSNLKNVLLADSITSIKSYAFSGCSSLKSIMIPDGVSSIGEYAFFGCYSLESINIPKSVTIIDDYFCNACNSLSNIDVSPDNPVYRSVDGVLYDKNLTTLIRCPEGKSGNVDIPSCVTNIRYSAFNACQSLTDVTIPDSVTTIGSYAFGACNALHDITIPNSVTVIEDWAFDGCTSFENVIIPSSVITIGYGAFYRCGWLKNVVIPNSVISIGQSAFYDCTIDNVTIPNCVTDIGSPYLYCRVNYTVIPGNMAYSSIDGVLYNSDATALVEFPSMKVGTLVIPNTVTNIYGSITNCFSLTAFQVEAGNSAYCSIDGVLYDKDITTLIAYPKGSNKDVLIPSSVTTIGYDAFSLCSLESIIIPKGVETIGGNSFRRSSLKSIYLPSSITVIGSCAFYELYSLSDIYYSGTESQWNDISIDGYNDSLTNATIHYNYSVQASSIAFESRGEPVQAKPLAAFTGESGEQDGLQLASFRGLTPGASYVLLVTIDENAEALLVPDNLLYVAQATANNDGSLTLGYQPRLDKIGSVKLFGPSTNDLSTATVTIEQFGDGECRVSVAYGDTILKEDEDYLLSMQEDGINLTVTVIGRGDYSGKQTVQGEKLAVTVRFDPNNGEIVASRLAKLLGKDMMLPIPTRDCCTFLGWSTIKDSREPEYSIGEYYTVDEDILLYAIWTLPEPYSILPSALLIIEDEAFFGCAFTALIINDGVKEIGTLAFAESPNLLYIYIPKSVTEIADNAFSGISNLTIYGVSNSIAETYATEKGILFIPLS